MALVHLKTEASKLYFEENYLVNNGFLSNLARYGDLWAYDRSEFQVQMTCTKEHVNNNSNILMSGQHHGTDFTFSRYLFHIIS